LTIPLLFLKGGGTSHLSRSGCASARHRDSNSAMGSRRPGPEPAATPSPPPREPPSFRRPPPRRRRPPPPPPPPRRRPPCPWGASASPVGRLGGGDTPAGGEGARRRSSSASATAGEGRGTTAYRTSRVPNPAWWVQVRGRCGRGEAPRYAWRRRHHEGGRAVCCALCSEHRASTARYVPSRAPVE